MLGAIIGRRITCGDGRLLVGTEDSGAAGIKGAQSLLVFSKAEASREKVGGRDSGPGRVGCTSTGYSEPSAMENWMLSGESEGSGAMRSMPISCSFVELVVLRRLDAGRPVLGSLNMLSGFDDCQFLFVTVGGISRLDV